MLSEDRLNHYRQALLERRKDIEAQLAQTEDMSQPVAPDVSIGRLTRQDAMQDQQMTLELRRRYDLQLTQIKTALDRIDQGTYGICVMCKEPIPEKRLELVPESPLCVQCLEKRGRGAR